MSDTPWRNTGRKGYLPVRCQISTPTGMLNVNDGKRYRLEDSTMSESSVTWRRKEVQSPFIEGTFLVDAVRENVQENLTVWVEEFDHYSLELAVRDLTDAVSQLNYYIHWTVDTVEFVWRCQTADYSIQADKNLRHATMSKVACRINRLPEVEMGFVTPR